MSKLSIFMLLTIAVAITLAILIGRQYTQEKREFLSHPPCVVIEKTSDVIPITTYIWNGTTSTPVIVMQHTYVLVLKNANGEVFDLSASSSEYSQYQKGDTYHE